MLDQVDMQQGSRNFDNDPEALDKSAVVLESRANIFLVDQVVKLIVNANCEISVAEVSPAQLAKDSKGKA